MVHAEKENVAILAKDMSIVKDRKPILSALSFTVKQGSITGLLGPSGSGKTTLMRTIVGVQKITEGTLEVLSMPAGDKQLRKKVGYVTQSPSVYADLTVAQNLKYFASLVRAKKSDIGRAIHEVHLDDQENQLVEILSGGQKTRVSLAIALLGDPELLVLDEPTVGLDPVLRRELWGLFVAVAKKGKTLLISSHVMDEAEHCDSLLLLRDGDLLWNSSKNDLLKKTKQQTVEDAFLAIVEEK